MEQTNRKADEDDDVDDARGTFVTLNRPTRVRNGIVSVVRSFIALFIRIKLYTARPFRNFSISKRSSSCMSIAFVHIHAHGFAGPQTFAAGGRRGSGRGEKQLMIRSIYHPHLFPSTTATKAADGK